ncbi:MAG: AraC family transcriptional regulator [Clostridiales bacterium]|nr:AraC family transcriptional regulator [Clostridiales bacterium]
MSTSRNKNNKFITNQNTEFDFSIEDSYGVHESSTHLHWHPQLELCYIKQGSGKYIINGHHYDFQQGDVFLINNDEIHLAYDDNDLIMQVTMFHPNLLWSNGNSVMDYEYLRPFIEVEYNYSNKISSDNPYSSQIIAILNEIQQEYLAKEHGYKLMIKSLLLKLMTVILRCFNMDDQTPRLTDANETGKLRNTFEYINDNFLDSITLEQLSQVSGLSISYFSSLFKQYTGLSPIDFILRKKIIKSKELLTTTDMKVIEISQICGFKALSNFNRIFKKYTDLSPSQYRKK